MILCQSVKKLLSLNVYKFVQIDCYFTQEYISTCNLLELKESLFWFHSFALTSKIVSLALTISQAYFPLNIFSVPLLCFFHVSIFLNCLNEPGTKYASSYIAMLHEPCIPCLCNSKTIIGWKSGS